jgi:endonuclease/exonuclease/phosphatase family metal-dependent hydrolase
VVSYRLDGVSTTTWRAPGPFPPGKLDYLFVSASRLEVLRSFAFDPADLSPAARRRLGVRTEDGAVTDHLPVVADIRVRQVPADAGGSRRQ